MRFLASVKVRIFLTCWILFSAFFATNVVREHYPAFALLEDGTLRCDRYLGFHADIFQHTDGHAYVGNNILGSLPAVLPLLVFDPVLDALENHSKRKLEESGGEVDVTYDTKHPNRQELWRKVRLAGLDLRFGASTALTSVLVMAPLSAFLTVLMYGLLLGRGVPRPRATWLAFLFAFGTPVFYRTAHLNHNLFLMATSFGAILLVTQPRPGEERLPLSRRLWAGFLAGCTFALDYAGAVPCAVLFFYFLVPRMRCAGLKTALVESVPLLLASLPPLLFLFWTQWLMYGNPFTPGQFVMPAVNYTEEGVRGISWPSLAVFVKNLFSPGWGLYTYAPLLLLGLWPARRYPREELILSCHERRWYIAFIVSFLLFCAANQYSLMQFNSGFRYLLPVVPLIFLQAADHLARMRKGWLVALTLVAVGHMTVLSMMREVNTTEKELNDQARAAGVPEWEIPGYWERVLTETPVPVAYERLVQEGPQLPWLKVLSQTRPGSALLGSPLLPLGLLALCGAVLAVLWRAGGRAECRATPSPHSLQERPVRPSMS